VARSYSGNYAYYLARRAEQETAAVATEAKLRGVLRRDLEWLQRGAKARSTKQKARIQRIEAMREAPRRQTKGNLSLASNQRRLGRRAIEAEELAFWASDEARAIREEVGFFQAIRVALAKSAPGDGKKSTAERELAIQQLVSRAVVSTVTGAALETRTRAHTSRGSSGSSRRRSTSPTRMPLYCTGLPTDRPETASSNRMSYS
jgi:ATPase subunit of ABC transporter with duplicated ATPase domains